LRARTIQGSIEFALSVLVAAAALLVALIFVVASGVCRFHVGFPGQLLIGSMLVSVVALKVSLPGVLHLPLALLAAMAGGALWAGIAAWLWVKRGVNEILSTLLLNLVAIQLLAWWVREPFHDPATPLPLTRPFPESVRWPVLLEDTQLHWDIVLIPIAVAIIAFLLARTTFGFRIRLVGAGESVARQAGASPERVGAGAIVLSGALAGLAGSSLILAGLTPAMGEDVGFRYGFTGIAVALLARNSAVGVIPAALLFAALIQGGGVMEGTIGLSSSLVEFVQGMMIILVLAATTLLFYARRGQSAGVKRGRTRAAGEPQAGAAS
jgi:simple sugar transport system permease protein